MLFVFQFEHMLMLSSKYTSYKIEAFNSFIPHSNSVKIVSYVVKE